MNKTNDAAVPVNIDGAEFALYTQSSRSNNTIRFDGEIKHVVAAGTIKPAQDGASVNLEFGKNYYLKETKTPEGYISKEESFIRITVNTEGKVMIAFEEPWTEEDVTYEETAVREASLSIRNEMEAQEVRFRKVDGFGKAPDNAAEFTVYRSYEGAVRRSASDIQTVIVDDTEEQSASSAISADSSRKINKGEVVFKVPKGVYYMAETGVPDGYEENTNVYLLLVGETVLDRLSWTELEVDSVLRNITDEQIEAQTGSGDDAVDYAIFLIDSDSEKALAIPDIAGYGIMNISAAQRKAILKKINNTFMPLDGAVFEMLRYDHTKVSGKDINGNATTSFTSGASGAYFIGKLPFGVYYLHETTVPSSVKQNGAEGWWYTLTVNADGISCSEQSANEPGSTETP